MSRPRLTEEQAIAKWGSLKRYHQHLKAVSRYQAEHYDEMKEYRRKNRAKLSQYTMEWRKTHHDQALASVKKRIKFKRETDPEFKQACSDRLYNRRTLIKFGILQKGWNLHYEGTASRDRWMYFRRDEHVALHSTWGKNNSDVTWERVMESPHLISEFYLYERGHLYLYRGARDLNEPPKTLQPLYKTSHEWTKEKIA